MSGEGSYERRSLRRKQSAALHLFNVPGVKGDKMLKQTHNTWEVNCSSQVYKNRPIIFDVWYTSYVYNIMLKAQISPLEKSLIC